MKTASELSIVLFPHPVLRYQAKPIRRVDSGLAAIVQRMFELMYEHRGVGLAATQIGLPLRLFVMNPKGTQGEGQELVMINPVVSRPRGTESGEEGCLSLPAIHGFVNRHKTVLVNAYTLEGQEIHRDFTGYEARIIQHEADHLDGKLFLDHPLIDTDSEEVMDKLDKLSRDFTAQQISGQVPGDQAIHAELAEWEKRYC